MAVFATLAIYAVLFLASYFLAGPPKTEDSPGDQSANEVKIPRNRVGLAIPSVFGRGQVAGVMIDMVPKVEAYGRFKRSFQEIEHKKEVGSGKAKTEITYYTYMMVARWAFSIGPVDEFTKLILETTRVDIDHPSSGCDRGERGKYLGGHWYYGTSTQTRHSHDTALHDSSNLLNYRNVAYATLNICLGQSPSPIHPQCELKRFVQPLTSLGKKVGDDANLMQVLYYILTDRWYLNIPESLVDKDSFIAAGNTLASEGIGGSYVVSTSADLGQVIREILDWCGAKLYWYQNKIHVKVIRNTGSATLTLTDDDIDNLSLEGNLWTAVHCAASLEWIDPHNDYETNWIYQIDHGTEAVAGNFKLNEFSYRVIASDTIAKKVLDRKMTEVTFPRIKATFTTTASIEPYQIIEIDSDQFGVTGTFRVTSIVRKGVGIYEIEAIELVEAEPVDMSDIPSVGPGVVTQDFESSWISWGYLENPIGGVYFWCKPDLSNPYLKGCSVTLSYDSLNLVTTEILVNYLGTLTHDVSITHKSSRTYQIDVTSDVAFSLLGSSDAGWFAGSLLLLINNEIISVRDVSVDDSGYHFVGVIRGFFKTAIASHSAGTDVFYLNYNAPVTTDRSTFAPFANQVLDVDMVPRHHFLGAEIDDTEHAETDSFTYKGNPFRPLPICNLQVNGQGNNHHVSSGDDVSISWRNQSRDGAGFHFPSQQKPHDPTPDYDQIRLEIYDGATQVREEVLDGTTTSYDYTSTLQSSDGVLSKNFTIKITPRNSVCEADTVELTVLR